MYTCECTDKRGKDEHIQMDRVVSLGKNEVKSECAFTQLCLTATPWTVAQQASLSMKFSRLVYRAQNLDLSLFIGLHLTDFKIADLSIEIRLWL